MILGHAHPKIVAALKKAMLKGDELRCPDTSGSGTCLQSEEGFSLHGIGKDGEFRNGSCDECDPSGKRLYGEA